ncbi:tetratricopeptide repeat protein [Actinomadura graeca]|uniref:Tetratricopeptide repeat protein n=1 Tax=Actinomadura graeca TaxID=2750812 RepID=A0ABX8QZD7_9ACTN|nr:BTAD domain-containing putative transcriptional regulator [Actinomadura graeca]QXJ23364.1 tetratricopeptide repeat protein [Actinomadura graeca]
MEFGLLGPLEVRRDGEEIRVGAPKLRVVLAALLLRANREVSLGELTDAVWGAGVPAQPVPALRVFVMRLRRLFPVPDLIRTMPDGYRLEIDEGALDLHRFGELASRGTALAGDGELERAGALLDEAMALWRAEPLADVPSDTLHMEAARLQELRLRTEHRRFEVKLRMGLHHDVIGRLRELTAANPLREDLWAQLMLALYRANRQAEAVSAYQAISAGLAAELGVAPGPPLRELYQSILVADPDLTPPGAAPAEGVAEPPRTGSQLPPAIGNFVGRAAEIERIAALLDGGGRVGVPVVTVSGPPGTGKTALAVRVAHQMRGSFPDGRLFVDLHAHSAVRRPSTQTVLARLLRALGHSADDIPVDEDEQVAAYRTALRGKRVLVTVDNAASAAEVRPLIPSEPGCAMLVTSRNELTALTARDGARRVRLDLLSGGESFALLTAILGTETTARQRAATERLAELCGRLPLALRIAASNLAGSHRPDIGAYIQRFLAGRRVRALAMDDDDHIAVGRAFDLSYLSLPPGARAMFRLLALFPGPDVAPEAMAVLAGGTPGEAATALEQLAAASLVQRLPGDRYQVHDLLSEYAADRVRAEHGEAYCDEARARLFDWYLEAVADAVVALYPEFITAIRATTEPAEGPAEGPPPRFGRSRALHWLDAERANLVAVVEHCSEHGPRPMAWKLAEALAWHLGIGGHHTEYLAAARAGLHAARAEGNAAAETAMIGCLVWEHRKLGDLGTALEYVTGALAGGDPADPGRPLLMVWHGSVRLERGELERARQCFAEVAELAEADALPPFLFGAVPLGLGAAAMMAGDFGRALPLLEEALAAATQGQPTVQRVECLMVVGRCLLMMGRWKRAAEVLRTAAREAAGLETRYHRAECLAYLSVALTETGDRTEAFEVAQEALAQSQGLRTRCIAISVWNAVGAVYRHRGDYGEAMEAHERALAAAVQTTIHPYGMAESHLGLARTHYTAGRLDETHEEARLALATAQQFGFEHLGTLARHLLTKVALAS